MALDKPLHRKSRQHLIRRDEVDPPSSVSETQSPFPAPHSQNGGLCFWQAWRVSRSSTPHLRGGQWLTAKLIVWPRQNLSPWAFTQAWR